MKFNACIFYFLFILTTIWPFPIDVIESSYDPVQIYSTAIKFQITLRNSDSASYNVTVTSEHCCLNIDANDTDCDIMKLDTFKLVKLGPVDDSNDTNMVTLMYRNLYARYRIGYCTFFITFMYETFPIKLNHIIDFDTTPIDQENNCTKIDQDPDRGCIPVDCAIKYKGHRNFYRNSTGKCEPVVTCNTRGTDGITITGYYDWEQNMCIRYNWFEDENYFKQEESDVVIPTDLDPSQIKYYPNLEPNQNMTKIDCNHGQPNGTYCNCDPGWVSSGIDEKDPFSFHWCDIPQKNPSAVSGGVLGPVHLTKSQEIIAVVCLSFADLALSMVCIALLGKVIFPKVLNHCFKMLKSYKKLI